LGLSSIRIIFVFSINFLYLPAISDPSAIAQPLRLKVSNVCFCLKREKMRKRKKRKKRLLETTIDKDMDG
jgi:hypothetical protein